MRGWASAYTDDGFPPAGVHGPVGLVVTQDFPDIPYVLDRLRAAPDDVFFVVREHDRFTRKLLEDNGLGGLMVLAPLVPHWKVGDKDWRRQWRDAEIIRWCSVVLLFRKTGATSTDSWLPDPSHWWIAEPKVRLIERGPKPAKRRRKARVPVGA